MSNVKPMLKVVLNPMLEIKVESINVVSGSIGWHICGPSQPSAALTHLKISQPKEELKSLTTRLLNCALAKKNEFITLVDHSPRTYAERLYLSFMETVTRTTPQGDDDEICQELMKLGELIKDVTKFEDRVLNAAGVLETISCRCNRFGRGCRKLNIG
ncbi:hypothetical protein IW262DRAFT_1469042 [Armillaria fumosa]|nr:hypothetical protein IW262DRAFT_1469042 [Armillaria fumosa]